MVPCPVCGSDDYRVYVMAPSHYGPESHQVTQCRRCAMVFTNPQLAVYEKEVEERGALSRHLDPSHLDGATQQARLQLRLLSRFASGRRLLDFGCGAGALVRAANQDGWAAVGFDLNRGLVEAANAHWQFDALKSGSLDGFLQQNHERFDAISSNQVFEHLQDPVKIGTLLVDSLNPGGVILIDVPNVYQPREWWSRGKTLDPTSHWCHFSRKTLSDLVSRIDCEVVYASTAPSLVGIYKRLGLGAAAIRLGAVTKSLFPPLSSGVCVIGRKRQAK